MNTSEKIIIWDKENKNDATQEVWGNSQHIWTFIITPSNIIFIFLLLGTLGVIIAIVLLLNSSRLLMIGGYQWILWILIWIIWTVIIWLLYIYYILMRFQYIRILGDTNTLEYYKQKTLLTEENTTIDMKNIQEVSIEKKWILSSICNYGNIEILTANDSKKYIVSFVWDPHTVLEDIKKYLQH